MYKGRKLRTVDKFIRIIKAVDVPRMRNKKMKTVIQTLGRVITDRISVRGPFENNIWSRGSVICEKLFIYYKLCLT